MHEYIQETANCLQRQGMMIQPQQLQYEGHRMLFSQAGFMVPSMSDAVFLREHLKEHSPPFMACTNENVIFQPTSEGYLVIIDYVFDINSK